MPPNREPETLQDLRRTDGNLRLQCDTCGAADVLDREATIIERGYDQLHRIANVKRFCGRARCQGMMLPAGSVPCSPDLDTARRRGAQLELVNLACEVLRRAAYEPPKRPEHRAPRSASR